MAVSVAELEHEAKVATQRNAEDKSAGVGESGEAQERRERGWRGEVIDIRMEDSREDRRKRRDGGQQKRA